MRYLAYCRKSTDEKTKQILSIDSQIEELKQFAKRENLNVVNFVTESKTAKTPGRQQFNKMVNLIEDGKVDGIVSWHPDRLARNSIDGGRIIYLLDTGKLKDLKFPTLQFDNSPQGKFMLSIAFGQSKYYVDNLSENVKRGNRHKLKLGIWPNKAPFGYKNDRNTRTIKVNKKESLVVKKAFRLFAKGDQTFTQIANFMFAHGITAGHGRPLHINQIKRMLNRTFYIGLIHYGGEDYQASHPCFISKSLFASVQQQLKYKDRHHTKRDIPIFKLTGLIKCSECGASITAEQHTKHYKKTKRTTTYSYYRCTKKAGPCHQPYISENNLTNQLTKAIGNVALSNSWAIKWRSWLKRDEVKAKKNTRFSANIQKQGLRVIDQKLDALLDLHLEQGIDSKGYKKKKNQLLNQKLKIQDKIRRIKAYGSHWLEPFNGFINDAVNASKIAHQENMDGSLKQTAQSIGSNFFLQDKKLIIKYKKPFASLRVTTCTRAKNPEISESLLCVTPRGIEPRFVG